MLIMRLRPTGSYCVHRGQISLLGEDVLNAREKTASSVARRTSGDDLSGTDDRPQSDTSNRFGDDGGDPPSSTNKSSGSQRAKAIAMLEEMQIPDAVEVMSRYPFELSGGMRQRVMIALAFSCEPQLIIADEPTTALDVTVQLQVLRLLKHKARASGTAVLFISHDMAVVSQLAHSVYVMYAGSVIESGGRQTLSILSPASVYHWFAAMRTNNSYSTTPAITRHSGCNQTSPICLTAALFAIVAMRQVHSAANVPALTACGVHTTQRCACWYPQQEVISV
ncbi:ATP-binding cassette domain-containing protein [Escherichia coli]